MAQSFDFWTPNPKNVQPCFRQDCEEPGLYPAPLAPDRLQVRIYLCLAHVRQHNSSWNFASDAETDHLSSKMRHSHYYDGFFGQEAGHNCHFSALNHKWEDPFNLLGLITGDKHSALREISAIGHKKDHNNKTWVEETFGKGKASPADWRRCCAALEMLGLEKTADPEAIRARFKALAKQLHPDTTGGKKKAEERLKLIIAAYKFLEKKFPKIPKKNGP